MGWNVVTVVAVMGTVSQPLFGGVTVRSHAGGVRVVNGVSA